MAEIVLQAISHSYDAGRRGAPASFALRDIELRWRDGGAYALLGPSGCGKTTLLAIISGLLRPTRGRVLYAGKDVTGLPSRQRNIAQVFQFPVVYDTMTVHQNLAFPLRNRNLAAAEIDRRVARIAESLELSSALHDRATGLTADQKQILALGRGLVREDVAAILFDEPLTVIDPHRKWLLRRKLKEIHKQFGHTLIYVTHDQTEALTFAEEVVVMQAGAVLQRGTPEDLFLRPAHTYVGYFIGSPGMNILACEVEHDGGQAHARIAGHRVALPARLAGTASGRLELGIRPEHIDVLDDGDAAPGLPLAIEAVEDHGRFRIVAGRLGGDPGPPRARGGELADRALKIRLGPHGGARPLTAGATVQVRFQPEHICLYRDSRLVGGDDEAAS